MNVPHYRPNEKSVSGETVAIHGVALGGGYSGDSEAPSWVMLLPAGEFQGRDGRGPFRLSDPEGTIAATEGLGMDAGIPIDYDHATDFGTPNGNPAPAAGWIRELEAREGALWGRVEWTGPGAAAVESREYRYISPVFQHASDGEVTRLLRAGLTNNPNLYLTAISARGVGDRTSPSARERGAGSSYGDRARADGADNHEEGEMETLLEQLREILALEATAPDDEIIAEVRRLAAIADDADDADDDGDANEGADAGLAGAENEPRGEGGRDEQGNDGGAGDELHGAPRGKRRNSKKPSPAHYVAVSQFQKVLGELNVLRAQRGRERAEQAVDDAIRAGKLVPAQRQWGIAYCQADYEGFAAFATRQPAAFGPAFEGARSAGAPRSARASLTVAEAAVCNQLGLDHDEYRMRQRGGRNDFLRLNRGGDGSKENR